MLYHLKIALNTLLPVIWSHEQQQQQQQKSTIAGSYEISVKKHLFLAFSTVSGSSFAEEGLTGKHYESFRSWEGVAPEWISLLYGSLQT